LLCWLDYREGEGIDLTMSVIYLFSIVTSVLVLVLIIHMLRKERFKERHALIWLIAGSVSLVVSIFPVILTWLAGLLGFSVPANLFFFGSIVMLFLVALQTSTELTTLEEKTRILAERTAILQSRLDDIEDTRSRD
jgi:hypothetical protein